MESTGFFIYISIGPNLLSCSEFTFRLSFLVHWSLPLYFGGVNVSTILPHTQTLLTFYFEPFFSELVLYLMTGFQQAVSAIISLINNAYTVGFHVQEYVEIVFQQFHL